MPSLEQNRLRKSKSAKSDKIPAKCDLKKQKTSLGRGAPSESLKHGRKETTTSPLQRELKKLGDCWNIESPSKDAKRQLRSGLFLIPVDSPKNQENRTNTGDDAKKAPASEKNEVKHPSKHEETKQENPVDRKKANSDESSEEETITFQRRKKLRSEVSEDELWEGIVDIRFKRLTPIKIRRESTEKPKGDNQEVQIKEKDRLSEREDKLTKICTKEQSKSTVLDTTKRKSAPAGGIIDQGETKASECRRARSLVDLFDELLQQDPKCNNGETSISGVKDDASSSNNSTEKDCNVLEKGNREIYEILDGVTDAKHNENHGGVMQNACMSFGDDKKSLNTDETVSEFEYDDFKVVVGLLSSLVDRAESEFGKFVSQKRSRKTPTAKSSSKEEPPTPKRSARLHEKQINTPKKDKHSVYVFTPVKKSESNRTPPVDYYHKVKKKDETNKRSVRKNGIDNQNTVESNQSNVHEANRQETERQAEAKNGSNICAPQKEVVGEDGNKKHAEIRRQEVKEGDTNALHTSEKERSVTICKKEKDDDEKETNDKNCEIIEQQVKQKVHIVLKAAGDDVVKGHQSNMSEKSSECVPRSEDRLPLKLIVKKTENGATVIPITSSQNYKSSSPSNDVSKSRSPLVQNEKKLSAKLKASAAYNSPKSRKSDETEHEKASPETSSSTQKKSKQTRSRTRSGEGDISELTMDPETLLKQPRVKGKIMTHKPKEESKPKSKKRKLSFTPEKKSVRRKGSPNSQSKKCKNNKRKTDEDHEDLLNNQCIAKHACVLWSSEQRRHFQLSHSGSTAEEIDKVMRKAWASLSDKEKLKYFQRAYSATKDENKHSSPNNKRNAFQFTPNEKVSKAMIKFQSMNFSEQDEELKKWLRMLNEVSTEEYAKLMAEFRTDLKIERQKRKDRQDPVLDTQEFCRKMLFRTIMNKMDTILGLYQNKKEKQKLLIKEAFDVNVKRLIEGDQVSFSPDMHSEKLAEVLLDLKTLESEMKLAVTGTPVKSESYNDILLSIEKIETDLSTVKDKNFIDDLFDDLPEISKSSQAEITTAPLLELSGEDIEEFFEAAKTETRLLCAEDALGLAEYFEINAARCCQSLTDGDRCCDMQSPSCVLSSLLMSDELRKYANNPVMNPSSLIDLQTLTSQMTKKGGPNIGCETTTTSDQKPKTGVDRPIPRVIQSRFSVHDPRISRFPRIIRPSSSRLHYVNHQNHRSNRHGPGLFPRREIRAIWKTK